MDKEEKLKAEIFNYVRELEKSLMALKLTKRYLRAHAETNAALHCATEILPSPLYLQVDMAIKGVTLALRTWKRKIPKIKVDQTDMNTPTA